MIWSKKGTQTRRKDQQISPYQPFEVSMCSSNILELLFSDLATAKKKKKTLRTIFQKKNISGIWMFSASKRCSQFLA